MTETIVTHLKEHGFSEYEAKAYVALVGLARGTAREVCEISGVPQGRIYSVLRALADRGFVDVEEGSPTFYHAGDPGDLFKGIREEYCASLDHLVNELRQLHVEARPSSPFWSIHSERGIRNRLKTVVRNATEDIIIIALHPRGLASIVGELKAANRRVNLTILVSDKEAFTGLGLRVFESGEELTGLFREMMAKSAKMKDASWDTELFLIVDGMNAITVGSRAGKKSATVIGMPAVCFMMKRLIEMLEPAVRGE